MTYHQLYMCKQKDRDEFEREKKEKWADKEAQLEVIKMHKCDICHVEYDLNKTDFKYFKCGHYCCGTCFDKWSDETDHGKTGRTGCAYADCAHMFDQSKELFLVDIVNTNSKDVKMQIVAEDDRLYKCETCDYILKTIEYAD